MMYEQLSIDLYILACGQANMAECRYNECKDSVYTGTATLLKAEYQEWACIAESLRPTKEPVPNN